MAKPKGINQKAKWRAHSIRIAKYAGRVQSVYDVLNKEIAKSVVKTDYDGADPFHFADYPLTKKKFEEVQAAFVRDLRSVIFSGTSEEWKQSNLVQDLLADKVLKFYGVKKDGKKHRVYYQTNNDALKAFQQRKDDGLDLSAKLWNQSKEYKTEMEHAISSAIEKGTSAVKLSKRLSKYLEDYPTLKKDYKEKFGKAVNCNDCEYRSIRLARSEINMAYRKAEQERWKQFDFVLGYEVKTTQNGRHVPDICDDLAGKYPKDFVFLGWHPNCMCYVIPILKTEEQFWDSEVSDDSFKDLQNRTKVEGDVGFTNEAVRVVSSLEEEYGVKLNSLILRNGSDSDKGSYSAGRMVLRDMNISKRLVEKEGEVIARNVYGENTVPYHEFGHFLADFKPWYFEREDYKTFSKKLGRGVSADIKKKQYEAYVKRAEKGVEKLQENGFYETAKSLFELWKEYESAKVSDMISMYSTESMEEFFAEAFAFVKINGKGKNAFADKVVGLLDGFYKKGRKPMTVTPPSSLITGTPDNFRKWLSKNAKRMKTAEKNNSFPYWYKDNLQYVK